MSSPDSGLQPHTETAHPQAPNPMNITPRKEPMITSALRSSFFRADSPTIEPGVQLLLAVLHARGLEMPDCPPARAGKARTGTLGRTGVPVTLPTWGSIEPRSGGGVWIPFTLTHTPREPDAPLRLAA